MPTTINGDKLKKCNVNGAKCKRINVNGVKVWSGIEALYNAGEQYKDLTGGWKTNTAYAINTVQNTSNIPELNTFYKNVGGIAYNTDNIKFSHDKGVGYGGIMMQTEKAINFKEEEIESLTIDCSTSVSGWGYHQTAWGGGLTYANWTIGLVPEISDGQDLVKYYHHDYGDNYIDNEASPIQSKTESFSKTLTGLSSLNGSYYVVVGIYRAVDAAFSMTLNSITCETK